MQPSKAWFSLFALVAFHGIANAQNQTPLAVGPAAGVTQGGIIPYFADGGGWTTTFNVTCWSTPGCALVFTYFGSNGRRFSVPMRITIASIAGDAQFVVTDNFLNVTLAFAQTVVIETLGQSSTVSTGGVDIASTALLTGFSTLRQSVPGRPDNEAMVAMEDRNITSRFSMAFDNRNGFATGVALTNLANAARADVVVTGVDLGNRLLFTGLISLDPLNGATFNLAQRFPATAGRVGLLVFETQLGHISGAGFRFNPGGAFTALPIFQIP